MSTQRHSLKLKGSEHLIPMLGMRHSLNVLREYLCLYSEFVY
jgi:hypothetical protein